MSGLADTGAGLNLGNIEYYQSVAERHPNLVFKFSYLKDLGDLDPFNVSGLVGVLDISRAYFDSCRSSFSLRNRK